MTIRMLQVCMLGSLIISGMSGGFAQTASSDSDSHLKYAQRMGFNPLDPSSRQHIQTGTFIHFKKNAPVLPLSALNTLKSFWEQKNSSHSASWQDIKTATQIQGGLKNNEPVWKIEDGRWVKATMDLEKENKKYNGFLKTDYVGEQNVETLITQLIQSYKASLEQSRRTWKGNYKNTPYSPHSDYDQKIADLVALKGLTSFETLTPKQTTVLNRTLNESSIALREIIEDGLLKKTHISQHLDNHKTFGYSTREAFKKDFDQHQARPIHIPHMLEKAKLSVDVLNLLPTDTQKAALKEILFAQKRHGVSTTTPLTLEQVRTVIPGLQIK